MIVTFKSAVYSCNEFDWQDYNNATSMFASLTTKLVISTGTCET